MYGSSGNSYDYGFRIYNSRLGKFLSVDPLANSYPTLTPYQFASNSPVMGIDLDGLELKVVIRHWEQNADGTRSVTSNSVNIDPNYWVDGNGKTHFTAHPLVLTEPYYAKTEVYDVYNGTTTTSSSYEKVIVGGIKPGASYDYTNLPASKISDDTKFLTNGTTGEGSNSLWDRQMAMWHRDYNAPESKMADDDFYDAAQLPIYGMPRKVGNLQNGPLAKATRTSGNFKLENGPPNATLYRADSQGNITSYIVYDAEGMAVKRVDVTGAAHNGVPTPHVIEYGRNTYTDPVTGQSVTRVQTPRGNPRPATADEIP